MEQIWALNSLSDEFWAQIRPWESAGQKTGSAHALLVHCQVWRPRVFCITFRIYALKFVISFYVCRVSRISKYDCGRGKYKKLCEGPRRISLDIRKSWRNIWSVSLWLFSKISFSQDFSGVKKKKFCLVWIDNFFFKNSNC